MRAVFDSVGKDDLLRLARMPGAAGMLVLFGQSSGVVPPLDLALLVAGGSLFLTRPSLSHYVATREELVQSAGRLFDLVGRGRGADRRRPDLRRCATRRRRTAISEARKTTGSTVLLP